MRHVFRNHLVLMGLALAGLLFAGCNGPDPLPDDSEQPASDAGINSGDAGTEQPCTDSSRCTTPPGQCYESQGTCTNGKCEYAPKETGAACNEATPPSTCLSSSGTCRNGLCIASIKPKGATCDDGNPCTYSDACDGAGSCSGTQAVCNTPPSQCYEPTGTCSRSSCIYKLKATGAACDDGNPCTLNDTCNGAGSCTSGSPKTCNSPPGQCYQPTGTCNSSNGTCQYAYKPSGVSCSDGNACTTSDSCNGNGGCSAGAPLVCSSEPSTCTTSGGCNPSTGCVYTYKCKDSQYCYNGTCCYGVEPFGNFTPLAPMCPQSITQP